ncbi:MAG: GyrI-like domain-containing protein [Rubrivivax sp.]|nr:MAG: GyrI-like domain-containing protein [Rubrivivax sp.]
MDVRLITRKPVRMAYLRYQGPYGAAIGRFWAHTFAPWLDAQNLGTVSCFGLSHDDPCVTPPERCRYDAGVAVPDGWMPNGGALVTELPGGRYAALDFKGTGADIGAAWSALTGRWLTSSGLKFDTRPCFEYYSPGSSLDLRTGVFTCELCVPVAPL